MSTPILNLIAQIATQEGVDPKLMQADALVESGGNPNAIGDHGTSYGLFQDHVGGAGGRTHGEARRYLDPATSIRHAAQRFKGAHDAEGIYRAQRPADHAGYVAKLNQKLRELGAGTAATASTGAAPSPTAAGQGGFDAPHQLLAQMLGQDDPVLGALVARKFAQSPAASPASSGSAAPQPSQSGGFGALESQFGLHRSSGDSERPGSHVQGSWHYQHDQAGHARAYDYGDARNPTPQLLSAIKWLRSHPNGVKEAFYDPAGFYIKNGQVIPGAIGGHGDHLHVAY